MNVDFEPYLVAIATGAAQQTGFKVYSNQVDMHLFCIESHCFMQAQDPEEIMVDLARDFSRGVELVCRCKFPDSHIANGQLMCLNDNLIYQGRMIGTNDRDSSDLLADFETWVSSEPIVIAQGEMLKVVKKSGIKPENTPSIEPIGQADTSQDSIPLSVVGGVAGVVGVLLLLAVVVIVTVVVGLRKRRYM